MGTVFIRVDASNQIGMGHLARCLHFANYALKRGVTPIFLTNSTPVMELIRKRNIECILIDENQKNALEKIKCLKSKYSIKAMLVDINYCTTFEQRLEYFEVLRELKAMGNFLITFEDLSVEVFPSNIVIIPYIGAKSLKIRKKEGSKYLLGPKFFPIREEFLRVNKNKTPKEDVETILVTMGGSDPKEITIKVVEALSNINLKVHLTIVLGSLSQISIEQVKSLLINYGGSFQVIKDVENMAELMKNSQLTITNSGLTKYELANMGLPTIMITTSREHVTLMDDFASYGTALHLGYCEDVTKETILNSVYELINDNDKRKKMSELGKQLVDGHGIERIFNSIPGNLIYA